MLQQASRNRAAAFYMLVNVLAWSTVPLAIDLGDGAENVLLFNLMWGLGSTAGILSFLLARYRGLLSQSTIRTLVRQHTRSWTFVILVAAEVDILVFAWSFRYIDPSVATVIYETAPLIMLPVGLLLFRSDGRYRDTNVAVVIPAIMAFAGLVFVSISQTRELDTITQASLLSSLFGISLGLLGALCYGVKIPLAVRMGSRIRAGMSSSADNDATELFSVLLLAVMSAVPLFPLLVLGLSFSGAEWSTQTAIFGLGNGLLAGTVARIFLRKANITTSNLGVNSLVYITPIFALAWLHIFSRIGIASVDYLIIGAVAIVTANLLINFQAEIRFGFRSLIIALWVCGTFVYFRGDLAVHFGLRDWLWPPGEYFTAVALAATVFTLILSFRVARLVARTNDETNRALGLFHRLDFLAGRGVIGDEVRGYILRIDAPEDSGDLANAYHAARQRIRRAYSESRNDSDRRELAEAATELDALSHSRQEGQDFGEYVALVIFAAITVALILFALDEQARGWNGFLTEMFTMLFCAVVIFLVVNVWDLQRERGAPVLRKDADDGSYSVVFRDAVSRGFEQAVSIVVVLAMTVAFGWLFWEKWVG